jgi:hypothetical protein
MPIAFHCACGEPLQAEEGSSGHSLRCPRCGLGNTVPAAADAFHAAGELPTSGGAGPQHVREGFPPEPADAPLVRATSGKAIASLILGVLALCLSILAGIPAILLGVLSLIDISKSKGRLSGTGLAIAGLILGFLGPGLSIALLLPAVQKVREAAARMSSSNNLKQLALAMHSYHDSMITFPPGHSTHLEKREGGLPEQSWRVALLPYLEEELLYRRYDQTQPWDSPINTGLLTPMPQVFAHPQDPEAARQGLTYYRVFVGPDTAFPVAGRSLQDFPDGPSNTILIVEAADPVPWTKPDELVYDPQRPLPKLGGHFAGGFLAALADGSVRMIPLDSSESALRHAIQVNDGVGLDPNW